MKKLIIVLVVFVLVLIVVFNSMYIVGEGEFACVMRFSKIESVIDKAGLYFKMPMIDSVRNYDKRVQIYDIQPSNVFTKDKISMTVDFYVAWEISDPLQFYSKIGTVEKAQQRLDSISYNSVKNLIGTLNKDEIINEDDPALRNDIYKSITDNARADAEVYGINITDIKIKRFDLPENTRDKVYERMISERNKLAGTITAEGETNATMIKNQADKDYNVAISDSKLKAEQTIAEGEEEYMRILATAFDSEEKQQFYSFIRELDVFKASLNGESKTVILSKDSTLAKLLLGQE